MAGLLVAALVALAAAEVRGPPLEQGDSRSSDPAREQACPLSTDFVAEDRLTFKSVASASFAIPARGLILPESRRLRQR